MIPNVLANRYASAAITEIWSSEGRVRLEREFWIAVLKAQRTLGLDIPENAIADYENVIDQIDLGSIADRERVTRHDVKARIEEFNELAGHEHIHKGMTSRDLTENVEQLQVYRSLEVVSQRTAAILNRLSELAQRWKNIIITARTHNVAAQPTTLGKRVAMFGEEILGSHQRLQTLIENYPVRGVKGAVGTQMDTISLFNGDAKKVIELEAKILEFLGMPSICVSVGQVYPRSLDLATVGALTDLASGASSFCKTLRLMAGHETASEGFAPGQTGSSAMPHKMNSRSCERVNGLHVILKGYLSMGAGLAGDQWNEGDVSCSVVRRVMLPDSFFAIDGLYETFLTILGQMDVYESVVNAENEHYLPFLMTTTIMMEAVKAGIGRETAHGAIKKQAVATVNDLRSGKIDRNNLLDRLKNDPDIPLDEAALNAILESGRQNSGAALAQIENFVERVKSVSSQFPAEVIAYKPGSIL